MGSQGAGRRRLPQRERLTAEDDTLSQIAREVSSRGQGRMGPKLRAPRGPGPGTPPFPDRTGQWCCHPLPRSRGADPVNSRAGVSAEPTWPCRVGLDRMHRAPSAIHCHQGLDPGSGPARSRAYEPPGSSQQGPALGAWCSVPGLAGRRLGHPRPGKESPRLPGRDTGLGRGVDQGLRFPLWPPQADSVGLHVFTGEKAMHGHHRCPHSSPAWAHDRGRFPRPWPWAENP